MGEYLVPGVYIEEKPNPRPIQGVGTAMAAFLGFAPSGPANSPVLITSWSQYRETFGVLRDDGRRDPHLEGAYLSHSVFGYFLNGGTRCYVTRLVPQAGNAFGQKPRAERIYLGGPAPTNGADPDALPHLLLEPASGDYYGEITVTLEPQKRLKRPAGFYNFQLPSPPSRGNASQPKSSAKSDAAGGKGSSAGGEVAAKAAASPAPATASLLSEAEEIARTQFFTLKVSTPWGTVPSGEGDGQLRREYELSDLSLRRGFNFVEDEVKGKVPILKVKLQNVSDPILFDSSIEVKAATVHLCLPPTRVDPSKALAAEKADFEGDAERRTGLDGFEIAEEVTMVCCPDLMAALQQDGGKRAMILDIQHKLIAHCERFKRMALLDPPPGMTPQQVRNFREREGNFDSAYAALYYPWVRIMGEDGQPMDVPPSGYVAGVWARSDGERGVHKAPANEVVRGIVGLSRELSAGEQAVLNPVGINCVRTFPGRGLRVWGARTLSSDPAWRYLNVRRLFNYVEHSIDAGLQWVVFEPNDPNLWSRVRRDITSFLRGVWQSGALFGSSDTEAFFVKCDGELNPQNVRDEGKLIIEVGIAPVKPAEFIIIRFSQLAQ